MKQHLLALVTPNKNIDKRSATLVVLGWVVITMTYWVFSGNKYLSTPLNIIHAWIILVKENGFIQDLFISTWLCVEAMFYAIAISLALALLSVLPIFRPSSNFVAKARFLSTVGLTFIFTQLTSDSGSLKISLLVFCITVFLITSFLSVIYDTKKEELDYARTLKMNEWEAVWHVMIAGKADQYLDLIRQNFAIAWMMLAMVENLCRAEGGIGVVLSDQNKYFHLDAVYAVQITILLVGILIDYSLGVAKKIFFPYSVLTLERK